MSITTPDNRTSEYNPVVATTEFPAGFPVFANEDISVFVDGVERTDFTVTASYTDSISTNAKAVFAVGIIGYVQVFGDRSPHRTNRFSNGGPLPVRDINLAFDTIESEVQEARRDIARSLKVPLGVSPLGIPEPEDNTVLGWDGDNLVNKDPGEFINDAGYATAAQGLKADASTKKLSNFTTAFDFNAVADGVTNNVTAFNNAAAVSGFTFVPPGSYNVGADLTDAFWFLFGAQITGLPDLNDSVLPTKTINDLRRLKGRIIQFNRKGKGPAMWIGDSNPWMEQYIRPSAMSRAELFVASPTGEMAISAATKTSDNPGTPGTTMACIAFNGYAINDRPISISETTAYAAYLEARKRNNGGAAFAMEMDIANEDATVDLNPNSPLSFNAYTGGLIVNSGAGMPSASVNPASFGILFGNNGDSFHRGIVFTDFSIDAGTLEAIAMPIFYRSAYYSGGSLFAYSDQREDQKRSDTNTAIDGVIFGGRRRRAAGGATQASDMLGLMTMQGFTGTVDYYGGSVRILQRTAFSAGTARTSTDLQARNANGAIAEVSLNGMGDASFAPTVDNVITLGTSAGRWSLVYAGTGTINTSDPSLKRFLAAHLGHEAADAEMAALVRAVNRIPIQTFQWLDALAKKGDEARIHAGVSAKDVADAFEAEGLDPRRYALFCEDPLEEWVDIEVEEDVPDMEIIQQEGIEQVVEGDKVVQRSIIREVERQRVAKLPVIDEAGNPVMQRKRRGAIGEDGEPVVTKGRRGKKVPKREEFEVPMYYSLPLTKKAVVSKRELRPVMNEDGTPKMRLALRYDQLQLLMIQALRTP